MRTALTRDSIVAAALSEFVRRGYRATSLRDIAATAEISHVGLLRHFKSKDELLEAVVATREEQSAHLLADLNLGGAEPGMLPFSALSRLNASMPEYVPLFAALVGEATTAAHPAHVFMKERCQLLISVGSEALENAKTHGHMWADRDAHAESVRLAAAWNGLQLLEQYLPERVTVANALETHQRRLALPVGWRDTEVRETTHPPAPLPTLTLAAPPEASGYRSGRERRARILEKAMGLFAQDGYGDTSLQSIAERVGISKSTLMRHYPSKDVLLSAVLLERDRLTQVRSLYGPAQRAADRLRQLAQDAAESQAETPGLIQLYSVLSSEAAPVTHPAHDYFAERYYNGIDYFADLFRAAQIDGDLPPHCDPETEAEWLVALWDGLQYQSLYDPDSLDIAAHLAAHLDDLLPR